MVLVHRAMPDRVRRDGEVVLDQVVQGGLVVLGRQHVVAAPGHDLLRNRRLLPHRVDRDHGPLQREHVEQGRNRGDLVGPVVGGDLAKDYVVGGRLGADEVHRRPAMAPVVRAAQRLAINRHHRPVGRRD